MSSLLYLKQCPEATTSDSYNKYPAINLKNELLSISAQRFSHGQSFIPVECENMLKRIVRAFFDGGFMNSLAEARSAKTREQSPLVSNVAHHIARYFDNYRKVKRMIFPNAQEMIAENIAKYSETRDWNNSPVRCMAWHPHLLKFAVAGMDDVVRIYLMGHSENRGGMLPVLKNPMQTDVTCMAWRPLSSSELVVASRQGLCFWTMEGHLHLGRNSGFNSSHVMNHSDKNPITSVQWNRDGTLLATASIGDRGIVLWEPDNGTIRPFRRLGPNGSLVKWSPADTVIFAPTVGRVFRIWDCEQNWRTGRWTCHNGNVQTACWSPCGRFLLFVSTAEPILYRLDFVQIHQSDKRNTMDVVPVVDLNACTLDANKQQLIGGPVQQLIWEPHGRYVAISFKNTNSLVLFRTLIQKFEIFISPAYYLSGETESEHPSYICFQPRNRDNDRSILSIAWSSGRLQFHAID